VYLVQLINKAAATQAQPDQLASIRTRNNMSSGMTAQNSIITAMKKQASIKDKRAKFF